VGGFDNAILDIYGRAQEVLYGGDSWSVAVVRHGWLVREFSTFNVAQHTKFDIWSCTKSVTATAWGILLDDARQGRLAGGEEVSLDMPVYRWIEEGRPLTDARKERITIRHLLTMTSGIPGEASGIIGIPNPTDSGPFEYALGHRPNRYGQWVKTLVADPGEHWEYSDAAYSHLSLVFKAVTGREVADFMQERVFGPTGMVACWDAQGGSGFLGPHTNAHTGLHVSARDLARFGYLALHAGTWGTEELVPAAWTELVKTPGRDNAAYGHGWWTNRDNEFVPGLPRDMFALAGFRSNRCYIIPSLDLVVARVGTGPAWPDERSMVGGILAAVL
jgi:CubicO group peptidase (beta-lactamase class C family)